MREVERRVILQVMDRKWREHLYEMDYLQEGIGLRAMAQRNPLIEYQREGYDMFQEMLEGIKEESVSHLFSVEVQVKKKSGEEQESALTPAGAAATATTAGAVASTAPAESATPDTTTEEPETSGGVEPAAADKDEAAEEDGTDVVVQGFGAERPNHLQYSAPSEDGGVERRTEDDEYAGAARNAPCPCGSGKKFKKCHGDPKVRA